MSPMIARKNRLTSADRDLRGPRGSTGGPNRRLPTCLIGLIALASFVTSCTTLGPDYKKPEAEVSQQWIDIDAPRVNSVPADLADWWTVFNDPVLNSLVEMAYTQNLTLRIAGLRILEARANLGIAVGSKYPQVQQINGNATRVEISDNDPGSKLVDRHFNSAEATFDLAWEIDFWGRFRRAIESAEAQFDASVADYDDVMVALASEVARAYVLIRTFEERLALAEQNVVTQERALRIADVKFRNGAVTELDVQQARAILANTEALIPVLETGLRQVKNALAVLLGLTPRDMSDLLQGPAPIPVAPFEVSTGVPAELLRRRPDVRRAERFLAAQSAQIGVSITDLYPRFSLVGSVGFRTSDSSETSFTMDSGLSDLFDSDSATGFLGPFFSWNIFNYGRIKNNIRVQDARFQQLLINYQNTVLTALAETENAIVAYLRSHEQANFLGKSVKAAQRSVQLSLIQYREGTTDFDRVLNTLTFLVEQQDKFTATTGDIATNLVAMYKALGGGWQVRGERKIEDYVPEEDKQQLRARTKYWRKVLPASAEAQ
ncbi:MAG: efflux transporter outer membrane subunit [Proteobacteria bacterium]|nr:efflux transporter outer membrane subunit [Pseudomonadota bacterium]